MKNDSLKKGLHPQLEVVTPKKNWAKPDIQLISVLSGIYRFPGHEGQLPLSI